MKFDYLTDLWDSIRAQRARYRYQTLPNSSWESIKRGRESRLGRTTFWACAATVGFVALILIFRLFRSAGWQIRELEAIDGKYMRYSLGAHWHGWPSMRHLVVFGDSWSATLFDPEKDPPSPESPLGNPPYPGETSTNGANWIGYLTYAYNESLILTADFAVGGATVDARLLSANGPHGLRYQAQSFAKLYAHSDQYKWKADTSLFIIWIGINDVCEIDATTEHLLPTILAEYAEYTDLIYECGARNFAFLTVPPIERAPFAVDDEDRFGRLIAEWNVNVTSLVETFTNSHPDTTTFLFDAHHLLDDVIDNPCVVEPSCGLGATTGYCPDYSFATHNESERCPYTIDGYLWMNPLHPTTVVHNTTAYVFVDALKAANVSGAWEHGAG